jgi:hypothetical protein
MKVSSIALVLAIVVPCAAFAQGGGGGGSGGGAGGSAGGSAGGAASSPDTGAAPTSPVAAGAAGAANAGATASLSAAAPNKNINPTTELPMPELGLLMAPLHNHPDRTQERPMETEPAS